MFCMTKVKAIYFCWPDTVRTRYPRGRKVSSAMSFAISIEPRKVM